LSLNLIVFQSKYEKEIEFCNEELQALSHFYNVENWRNL